MASTTRGERNFYLTWVTTWSADIVDQFAQLAGPLSCVRGGTYHVGVADPLLHGLSNGDKSRISCPRTHGAVELDEIIVFRTLCTSALLRWVGELSLRYNSFAEELAGDVALPSNSGPAENPSIWTAVSLATRLGMRLPTEEEWEAAVFGCKSREDLEREFWRQVEFARARSEEPFAGSHIVSELTSTVGFGMEPRSPGEALEDFTCSSSLRNWPGVVSRGYGISTPNLFSRYSLRFGHPAVGCRFVVEAKAIREMDPCPFKDHLLSVVADSSRVSRSAFEEYFSS